MNRQAMQSMPVESKSASPVDGGYVNMLVSVNMLDKTPFPTFSEELALSQDLHAVVPLLQWHSRSYSHLVKTALNTNWRRKGHIQKFISQPNPKTTSQATENGIPSSPTHFTLLNFTGLLQSLMMLMVPGGKNIARNINNGNC